MTERIITQLRERVLHVQFNRPDKKNALTGQMYGALSDALESAEQDAAVRIVSLTGSGDSFTAGNDLDDFLSGSRSEGEQPAARFLRLLSAFPKPVVAAVNGLAVGIGVTMLLHCDIVIASDKATFRVPFVDLGLVPEAASSLLLPRLAGHQRTASLMMCGEILDAAGAKNIGLVRSTHAPEELNAELMSVASAMAAKPPRAMRLTKALLKGRTTTVDDRMKEEMAHFRSQLDSAEAREAMLAFKEKRKPDFSKFA